MKYIIILALIFTTSVCFAEVKLFRYVDKISGDEQGICYSDKDGNPQANPSWNAIEISEKDKQKYIDLKISQYKSKPVSKTPLEIKVEKLEKEISDLKAK